MRIPCRSVKTRAGFTLTEVLAVMAIVTSVSTATFVNVKDKGKQMNCVHNMRQIATGLLMYEMSHGKLPDASFFPGDPMEDKDSIRVIMRDYPGELFVCPSAPKELAEKGLTFLWNDKYSGKALGQIRNPKKTWLLIEVNAVSDERPPPHPGGYNILYADLQTVKTEKELPKTLAEEIRARVDEDDDDE